MQPTESNNRFISNEDPHGHMVLVNVNYIVTIEDATREEVEQIGRHDRPICKVTTTTGHTVFLWGNSLFIIDELIKKTGAVVVNRGS
jgi:hypothetical protein